MVSGLFFFSISKHWEHKSRMSQTNTTSIYRSTADLWLLKISLRNSSARETETWLFLLSAAGSGSFDIPSVCVEVVSLSFTLTFLWFSSPSCLTAPADSPPKQKGKWRPDTKSIGKTQRYLSVLSGDLFVYTLNEGGPKSVMMERLWVLLWSVQLSGEKHKTYVNASLQKIYRGIKDMAYGMMQIKTCKYYIVAYSNNICGWLGFRWHCISTGGKYVVRSI